MDINAVQVRKRTLILLSVSKVAYIDSTMFWLGDIQIIRTRGEYKKPMLIKILWNFKVIENL